MQHGGHITKDLLGPRGVPVGGGGAVAAWWNADGVIPASAVVGAYQGIGADSYEASLVNLAKPGTNNLVPTKATYPPQWSAQKGWSFSDLAASVFDTGLVPDTTGQNWSMMVWLDGGDIQDINRPVAGKPNETGGRFYILPNRTSNFIQYFYGSVGSASPGVTTGSVGMAGNKAYRNGVDEGITITADNKASTKAIRVGGVESFTTPYHGHVRLCVVCNTVLTPEQVAALATAGDAVVDAAPTWTLISTDAAFGRSTATKIILDSDLGSDCDDAGVIAVLHALWDDGKLEMIAQVNERTNQYAVSAMDAINTYYGHADLPIGANKGAAFQTNDTFAEYLTTNFPNDLTYAAAPEAVDLYRQTLAAQADGTVRILCVGPLRLLHQLLISEADGHSALTGSELVAAKVGEIVIVGGFFPNSPWAEYNLRMDAAASNYVFANCPVPITIVGIEIADPIYCGAGLSTNTPVGNPVRAAYEQHVGVSKGRPAWDTMSSLYIAFGLEDGGTQYFYAVEGTAAVNATTGMNTFTPTVGGDHAFLVRAATQTSLQTLINGYMETAPPE